MNVMHHLIDSAPVMDVEPTVRLIRRTKPAIDPDLLARLKADGVKANDVAPDYLLEEADLHATLSEAYTVEYVLYKLLTEKK